MTVTHFLDFVCEGWTGNFETEFVSYVFGHVDYDRERNDYSKYLPAEELEQLQETFDEFLDGWYGEYGLSFQEPGQVRFGPENELRHTVQVRVMDTMWQEVVTPELIEGLKERAERFFTVYLEHLPSYQMKEGKFLGLVHSTSTVTDSPQELL